MNALFGVELILARSPQAKGRVERMNGTLQDRLVKAMRRAKIADLEAANRFLEEEFLPGFNPRFPKPATKRSNWHRRLSVRLDWPRILSVQETRVVQNDWTVRWRNEVFQLPEESAAWVQPRDRVTVCAELDGRVRVFVGERELSWSRQRRAATTGRPRRSRGGPTGSSQGQQPGPTHPWRGRPQEVAAGAG